jgi:hypothetical protein
LFGSASIVLAGTASNAATNFLKNMGYAQANKIMKEAYKNPELMKILLSRNITEGQLNKLNSGQFQTGRTLYRGLMGLTEEE